jgi:hypothetical protein
MPSINKSPVLQLSYSASFKAILKFYYNIFIVNQLFIKVG